VPSTKSSGVASNPRQMHLHNLGVWRAHASPTFCIAPPSLGNYTYNRRPSKVLGKEHVLLLLCARHIVCRWGVVAVVAMLNSMFATRRGTCLQRAGMSLDGRQGFDARASVFACPASLRALAVNGCGGEGKEYWHSPRNRTISYGLRLLRA
jgi:hypothetical protein